VAERSSHDMKYCKDCYRVIKEENKNKKGVHLPTVEELNAKFTGDLPALWEKPQPVPVKKRAKRQAKEQMSMDLEKMVSAKAIRAKANKPKKSTKRKTIKRK